ncbi:hypothetical protein GW17_00019507 [Ensete ventricosum]|nr:hypothetical protein GW17_00019507 [Ensete ventricosum]
MCVYIYIYSLMAVNGCGGIAGKLTSGAALDAAGLVAVALCHGLALFVAVAIAANISGGHVNPAVTFGLALGGQITVLTGLLYWVAQLLGAVVGALLLKFATGLVRPTHYCTACPSSFRVMGFGKPIMSPIELNPSLLGLAGHTNP